MLANKIQSPHSAVKTTNTDLLTKTSENQAPACLASYSYYYQMSNK